MLALRKELEEMRDDRERSQDVEARRAREDEDVLQILRERCERLEEERADGAGAVRRTIFFHILCLTSLKSLRLIPRSSTNYAQTWRVCWPKFLTHPAITMS